MTTMPPGRSFGPDEPFDPHGPAGRAFPVPAKPVSARRRGAATSRDDGGVMRRLLMAVPCLLIAVQTAPAMAGDTIGSPSGPGSPDIVQLAQVMSADDIIERFTATEQIPVEGTSEGLRGKHDPRGVTVVGLPTIRFDNVEFALGSADLTDAARRQLDEIGEALTSDALSHYGFRISGHTDATGTEQFNQDLSELRANSVRDYLTHNYAISDERLEAIGLGESAPAVPSDPFDPSNRRVEITRTDTGG